MVDNLLELLNQLNYPVIRQGSLGPEEAYPDTFFTFWNSDEAEHSAYDNDTVNVDWTFQVNVYSTDPDKTYDLLNQARTILKSAGYTIATRGYDVASDEITHTGRGMLVMYLQNSN
jgi:hypothetical protein